MAKMKSRTEALVNAYLNNYQNANATTVSSGQSAQRSAQSKGSAIMNATDKTLPTLKDYSADVMNGIVKSAENAQSTAISNLKLAQKQMEEEQKAAEKAAKSSGKSSKSSSKKKDSTDDADLSSAAADALAGGSAGTASTTTAKTSSKTDAKKTKQKSAAQLLVEKKIADANAGKNKGKTVGKTYAEQKDAGNTTAKPAQSRATGKAGNVIGSTAGALGQAPSASEKAAAKAKRNDYKSQQEDTAAALKKLHTDADYRAELAQPGRKLTSAEVKAVNQYEKSTKNTGFSGLKRVFNLAKNSDNLSEEEYAQKAAELNAELNQNSALRSKAQGNGAGQSAQAFTAGIYDSVPFLIKAVDAMAETANGIYQEQQQIPALSKTLDATKSYNPLAAGAGTMVGKGMQYNLFNTAMAGTKLADAMGKVGGKVVDAASKVPVLGRFATPAVGEALGRILTDQTADTALDTIPSLVNDLQTYDEQQSRMKNGEQIDDALTPGQIGLNTLGNVAQNFAFNAIPEVGGAVLNRLKGTAGDAAQGAAPARNIVQPEANGTTGLAAELQQLNAPDAANRSALDTLDELRGQVNLNGAQEKEAEQLRRAVLQRQQEIGDEAKLAMQNSDTLPIDEQAAKAYNEVNGGVANDNLGAGVRADVSVNTDAGGSYEPQPGGNRSGIVGQTGEAGLSSTARGNGRGVQSADAENAAQVAEWAKSITGKGRQSVYTRRIENLYNQMQNGASRESLAEEAANIAAGIVKESDFAEPLDEATTVLRQYMKDTPIRLDEKAAGDILYTSGLKNIQQYNFQNGTKFSLTDGVPYDTAMQELSEMGVGVNGSSVDDLLKAVDASNAKPLIDSDQAAAVADYYRDFILDGKTGSQPNAEDFADWLDVQSFDQDAPDYVQRLLERDSIPTLNQTAETVSDSLPEMELPLNGSESLPAHSVGANETQYNREEVPNQDYGVQQAMGGKIDADEAAAAGIGQQTHTVYSRAEGKDTAKQDFDLLVQQNGDILSAGRTVADDLTQKVADGKWDADDVYRGYYAADQLQNMLNSYEKGSADAQLVQAQIEKLNRAVSTGQSKAGQTLGAGRWAQIDEYTPVRKFEQIAQNSVNKFGNTRQGKQLKGLANDIGEMADTIGPMDEEFTAFIRDMGVDTGNEVQDQLEYIGKQIQETAKARNVKVTDDQVKAAAASVAAGGDADDVFNAMARKSLGIENLSQEDYDYAKDVFNQIKDMPDSKERYDLEMSVYSRMANYMQGRSFADKVNNIRYLAMLGNTRTHVRNVMGNVMMGTVVRAKDNVAGVLQLALPESQRTKAIGTTLTADGRKMVDSAKKYAENEMYTTLFEDGKFNVNSGLEAARKTYTSKAGQLLEKASDINSSLLEKEDSYFLKSEFGNSMASFLKARGYDSSIFDATDTKSKEVLRQAAAQALSDAKEATFHEDNFLSTAFKNFANDTKQHGPAGKIAYAVTEGILPFKKTPLNIAKNALEYNPIGGTVEAIYRAADGQGAARVIDAAAKGITGGAVMGVGYLMAKNGLLTGGGTGDDRADNYTQMLGEQDYAVKIPGKGTYTLDWASPASVPLLIGAEIAQDEESGGEFNLTQALDKFRHITQPVLDTTMLQGLNDTLDSVSYAESNDKLATLATSALGSFANQFVPTALGQVARTIDPMRRSTYGGGDTKNARDTSYNINKMKNKIPGLSQQNEAYIDQWGREQASLDGTDDSASGTALRGLYNFASPGYYSAENVTPVDEYLQGLYSSTNDSKVYPEKASSKITVDSENHYMTPEEKTEYAKTSGQTAYDIIDSLRQNDLFLKLPEDQQSELVQKAYSVAKTVGGVAAVGDGVSGTNSKEYQAYQQGGVPTLENYLLTKNAIDVASDGSEESLKKADKTKILLNQGLDSESIYSNYMLLYPSDEKVPTIYNQYGADGVKDWLQYINAADLDGNGSVSQAEAQATLDQMNLTDQLKAAYWQMTNKNWKSKNNPY